MNKAAVALVIILVLLISTVTTVQLIEVTRANPSTQWIKDIESFSLGNGNSVIQTADGGYALTGGKDGGFLLLKTNSSGDVQWEKTYGTEAEFTSFANAIVQANDGGYLIAGQGTPWPNFIGPNGTLFNLIKTDPLGNVQWNRSYSTKDTPFLAKSLIKTSDGGYAVAGYAETGHTIMGSGTGFVCLVKINEAGNIEWKKQIINDAPWSQIHISVVETGDSGYALLTVADFTENTVPVVENADFWLIKTDSNGDIQWSENYGGPHNDLPSGFIETSDGSYLLGGSTLRNSTVDSITYLQQDAWLVKTDSEGNMLWNKTYGGDGGDVIRSVLESQDGGYVVAAMVDVSSENPPSGALIFKTDPSGNTEWNVEYQGVAQPIISPLQIIQTEDGAYSFTGYIPQTDSIEYLPIVLVKLTAPSAIPEDSWSSKASLPLPSGGIIGFKDKIFAFGGSGEYDNVTYSNNAVFEYDPSLDSWIAKEVMPIKRSGFVLAVIQNKIYVIGGSEGLNQVYDPVTGTWENRTSVPTPRTQLEANVVDGKIYLIGGRTGGQMSTVALNEVYDPQTDTWTTKEPMRYPVVQYASAVVDNKIYVIGGQDEFHDELNLDVTQIFDTTTDTWSLGAPIPKVVWQAAAGATTGEQAPKRIYVFGGLPEQSLFGTDWNQVYNPETDTWTDAEPMPTARYSLSVAVLNDMLYVMRGMPYFNLNGVYCHENEQYTPVDYVPSDRVYIRSDGSIRGTDKIMQDGAVYTFVGDVNGSVIIECDDVVLDGGGFVLQGTGSTDCIGVDVSGRNNVTVRNMVIKRCGIDIRVVGSSNCVISGNTIDDYHYSGVYLENSSCNTVCANSAAISLVESDGNVLLDNNWMIRLSGSSNNTVSGNADSIELHDSSNNTISGNNASISLYTQSEDNVISENRGFVGLWESSNNNITGNGYGMIISRCDGRKTNVMSNNFIGNIGRPYELLISSHIVIQNTKPKWLSIKDNYYKVNIIK